MNEQKKCHWCGTMTDNEMFCNVRCWNYNFSYHTIRQGHFIEEEMSNECKPIESNELSGDK